MAGQWWAPIGAVVLILLAFQAVFLWTPLLHGVPGVLALKARDSATLPVVTGHGCQPKRIGHVGDGGWWICGKAPALASRKGCVVYSYGIRGDFTFDEGMVDAYGCEVHGFDPSPDGIESKPAYEKMGGHYHMEGLGPTGTYGPGEVKFLWPGIDFLKFKNTKPWVLKTLADERAALGHKEVTVLKIDTEGAEWGAVSDVVDETGSPWWSELLFELHFPPEYHIRPADNGGFTVYRVGPMSDGVDRIELLRRLSELASLWRWNMNIDMNCCIEAYFIPKVPVGRDGRRMGVPALPRGRRL